MRIDIAASPYNLGQLEALCAVARQQGFPSDARVRNNGTELTVTIDPQYIFEAADAAEAAS